MPSTNQVVLDIALKHSNTSVKTMTEKDRKIYDFLLKQNDWVGPTAIGLAHDIPYNNASSWCMSSLKRLISGGKVETKRGRYRIKETTVSTKIS